MDMVSINIDSGTLGKFKEIIDFIYEATVKPEGYTGSLGSHGSRYGLVCAEMVRRGILVRTGTIIKPTYKWTPAMSPTKAFYESIASACVMREREATARCYAKRAAQKKKNQSVEDNVTLNNNDTPVVVNDSVDNKECCSGIENFSDAELWEELKRRGCYISGGQLAKKVVFYFE